MRAILYNEILYLRRPPMVTINNKKCTGCGSCASICHESCMTIVNGKIRINHEVCSTCMQCIAVCPYLALSWDNVKPVPFDSSILPDAAQVDELLKERRTVRHFKKNIPPKKLVEEIINYGAYAPAHSHDYRVAAISDENIINEIDANLFGYIKKIYGLFFKPKIMGVLLKFMPSVFRDEFSKAKPKLEKSIKAGVAYRNRPPVMIFVIGDKRSALINESTQYVIYNMNLYAMTKGLGFRNLVGNQMFFNKSNRVRKILGMKNNELICGTFGLGYPEKKFRNKVNGRKMYIEWI